MQTRNYDTISPSARMLLLMKGTTPLPFARRVAELMMAPEEYVPDMDNKDPLFWGRVLHFESRYLTIDSLLSEVEPENVLELSSGYSFRGLDMTLNKPIHYIDTDLPAVIALKKHFINDLIGDKELKGNLEMLPLNAVDEKEFEVVIGHFSPKAITVVNEGLLMYLDDTEKRRLCGNIHRALKKYGGHWITADVYIRRPDLNMNVGFDEQSRAFFDQHNIEEKKFESFEAAEKFFNEMGFELVKEAGIDYSKLSSVSRLMENVTEQQLERYRSMGKIQATWMLKAV